MIPTLLELGPIPIRSFGLMVALALIVGSMRLARSFSVYGLQPALAERYVMVGGVAGIVGARIWFLIENWSWVKSDLLGAVFASAGFTFYGGFIVAAVAVAIAARLDGTKISTLCDALGPCLTIGYAIGRVGCQLSGDGDYGVRTDSWLGMSYSTGVVPTLAGELVYPTPLFESALAILVLIVLTKVERSKQVLTGPFQRFGLYLTLISIERILVEIFRGNEQFLGPLSQAQVIGSFLLAVGIVMMGLHSRRGIA